MFYGFIEYCVSSTVEAGREIGYATGAIQALSLTYSFIVVLLGE